MKRLFLFSLVALLGFAFVIPISPSWSAGTLEVTSPNGGDSWNRGGTYSIEWDKGDAGRFVKIQLLKAGKLYKLISRRTKNDGSHKWKIPSSLNPGVAFKVKIKSISKQTVFDASNRNFRIRKARAITCSKSLSSGCGWEFGRSMALGLKPGAKKHGYRIVSAPNHPVHYGKKSERFVVKPGWCSRNSGWDDCKKDRERSELIQWGYKQKEGDEYWYRWSIYIPKNHRNLYPAGTVYGQFHQTQPGTECDTSFQFVDHTLGGLWFGVWRPLTADGKIRYTQIIQSKKFVGYWNDIVAHARWTKKNDGWLKLWANGQKKIAYQGKTMTCMTVDGYRPPQSQSLRVYFKYGVYRASISKNPDSKTVTTIAYYDGVVRSKSKKGMFDPLLE